MSGQDASTTFKLSYDGRKKPIVTTKVNLLSRLSALNGKVVRVCWITATGNRRLKLVDVDQIGVLKNHVFPSKTITEDDFNE